eukprot:CAMPEP_0174720226 /NCGR_PEP_ID=MMETSP1094-20130205/33066_1 /TAXON_ID=156173 /ORGANISM="Chrysochromulina brevifilum, Strain UTEX LB 985" /LENGTH=45 /DNA_ID= /DNA_START= /DNA_END= /DNA_ORIENTATION=
MIEQLKTGDGEGEVIKPKAVPRGAPPGQSNMMAELARRQEKKKTG